MSIFYVNFMANDTIKTKLTKSKLLK